MQRVFVSTKERPPALRRWSRWVTIERHGAQATATSLPDQPASPWQRPERVAPASTGDLQTGWTVLRELAGTLFDSRGLRLPAWLSSGAAEIIKTGRHRTVYRLRLPAGRFYLKHFKATGLREVLQSLVRPCRAELEFRAAGLVARAGVPTVQPVAWGLTARGPLVSDSFLICREIEDVVPLDEFVLKALPGLSPARAARIRQQIAVELGKLAAALHRARIIHRDFHAGNILARLDADDRLRLWLIDLHSASRSRYLTRQQIEYNLGQLNNFFSKHHGTADRRRFFGAYWDTFHAEAATQLVSALPAAIRRLERTLPRTVAEAYRRGDRKWVRGNRRLIIADTDRVECRGVARLGAKLVGEIRDDPQSLFSKRFASTVMQGRGYRTAAIELRTELGAVRGTAWQLSSTEPRSTWHKEFSRVRQAWETGHSLLRRGIEVPEPLLFVEQRAPGPAAEYLVTADVANSVTLRRFLDDFTRAASPGEREVRLQRVTCQLAAQLQHLHACGFDHRALSVDNILITNREWSRCICFTSLLEVRRRRRFSFQSRAMTLSRLNQSASATSRVRLSNRLRFLRRYLGPNFDHDWKSVWRAVEVQHTHRDQHHRSSGATGRRRRSAA